MKLYFAVKDTAVQAFGTPFLCHTQGEAIRSLGDEVNRDKDKSAIAAHPEHYELYELGKFDELTGMLMPNTKTKGKTEIPSKPLLVIKASQLIKEQK